MNNRKIISLIVVLVGAALMYGSDYIAAQVALGKQQIAEGQQKVDTVNSLFSQSKYTQPAGKQLTKSGQQRINAGQADVDRYEALSNQLWIAGIVVIAAGAGMFLFWKKK
jgi:hypothetical protein